MTKQFFMKITPKQYGEALYQSVINKKDSRIKAVLDNFVKLLIDNNDISKLDKIIGRFKKTWNSEEGVVEAEAVSARELDKKIVKLLNDYIVQLSGASKVLLKQKIDKNVL
ncbi:MAG: F0F1 ATP synthase subunit delta, partial [bacterium]|nr:F0F1 ATP synthase subunit delta [bacterium]